MPPPAEIPPSPTTTVAEAPAPIRAPAAPVGWLQTLSVAGGLVLFGPHPLLAGGLVAVRWALGLGDGREQARLARRQGRGRAVQLARMLLPMEWRGAVLWLRLVLEAFIATVARRPLPPAPPGERLEDRRRGMYDAVFIVNLLSFVVEVPVMALVMHGAWSPAWQLAVHVLETALVVFVVGDRRHVQAAGHLLEATHLWLRAGARAEARVPLSAIEGIEPLPRRGGPWAWRQAHRVARRDVGIVSVLDTPNLAITLSPQAASDGLAWTRFQVTRPMPRHLLVYVDDPAAVAARVRAAATPLH